MKRICQDHCNPPLTFWPILALYRLNDVTHSAFKWTHWRGTKTHYEDYWPSLTGFILAMLDETPPWRSFTFLRYNAEGEIPGWKEKKEILYIYHPYTFLHKETSVSLSLSLWSKLNTVFMKNYIDIICHLMVPWDMSLTHSLTMFEKKHSKQLKSSSLF